jgi:toxin ParE1/3/4
VSRQVRLHPAAQQELEEAAAYYDLEGPGLGAAFLDDFERAGEQIRLLPESSPLARKHARRKLMARFPYAVVYSPSPAMSSSWRCRTVGVGRSTGGPAVM